MYIAHKTESGKLQSVKEHSVESAEIASQFSIEPLKELVYNTVLLHDIGKYQNGFQQRINGKDIRCPHALCGALEVDKIYPTKDFYHFMMKYVVAGHHSGLHDFGNSNDTYEDATLTGVLQRECQDYSEYGNELEFLPFNNMDKITKYIFDDCKTPVERGQNFAFFTRYIFSCLTDADSLNTEEFCNQTKRKKLFSSFENCLEKIETKLNSLEKGNVTDLQKARGILQAQAYEKSNENTDIYLMNMPTGSGKTLCSMKFALKRALETGKKRIIYIIPYNSIIDQTSSEFEKIFSDDLKILRHQSSYTYENCEDKNEDFVNWANKSIENWDCDFIITTAVQFFESLHGNKRGKLRKVHNLSDTILIFDEAHLMPIEFLQPCLMVISQITKYLRSEAIFLTATMPNYIQMLEKYALSNISICDLISDKTEFSKFKKCRYKLAEELSEEAILCYDSLSKLIIVNTKDEARNLYNKAFGKKYNLSTYLIGKDRLRIINEIKDELKILREKWKNSEEIPYEERVTVVSTSLIEAGVDLDFDTVLRELSGLDNILQSGGRCNREGTKPMADVIVFTTENPGVLKINQAITKEIFSEFEDVSDALAIEKYYEKLFYRYSDEIIKHRLKVNKTNPYKIDFMDYAQNFKFIEDNSISIVIPCDEFCSKIKEQASFTHKVNPRKLEEYTVSVKEYEFDDLHKLGVLDDYGTGVFFLTNPMYYNKDVGILFECNDNYID